MSWYSQKIGYAIINALEGVPAAQPAQVAGYWAIRDFWISEFRHFLEVESDYERRVSVMERAYDKYIKQFGGPHYRDQFGTPKQAIVKTTSNAHRRRLAGDVRTALKQLAERALNLKIADDESYDQFLESIKVTNA